MLDAHVKRWKQYKHTQYMNVYYQKHPDKMTRRTKEEMRLYMQSRRLLNPDYGREAAKSYKLRAMSIISNTIQCARCGCDDIRFLEINHKNGDGANKRRNGELMGAPFYRKIIQEKRTIEDLELLCRPCNHIHYLEFKFKERIPLKVVWQP